MHSYIGKYKLSESSKVTYYSQLLRVLKMAEWYVCICHQSPFAADFTEIGLDRIRESMAQVYTSSNYSICLQLTVLTFVLETCILVQNVQVQ